MYIRTKDGRIIAFGKEYAYPTRIVKGNQRYIFTELTEATFEKMKEFNHWEILKQSENLAELCDEFVYIKDGIASQYLTISFKFKRDDEFCALRNKLTANGIVEISKGISKYELENGELKFAIWTDKGLIYVAKMNDKGDLELI